MRIVFDSTTLHGSKSGAITAVVYFDVGAGHQFPVAGWNDFVVVVSGWWIAALEDIARGAGEVELRFMDGPYRITVTPHNGTAVLLRCIEDRARADVVGEVVVAREDLVREVGRLADDVVTACTKASIDSNDLENLRKGSLAIRAGSPL